MRDSKDNKVNLTVIGTGISIIADRDFVHVEQMRWSNKKRLFDILKRN